MTINCEPRTQKARGLRGLQVWRQYFPLAGHYAFNALSRAKVWPGDFVPGVKLRDYDGTPSIHDAPPPEVVYPAFARPCPTVPRHGFVDSRVVRDTAALMGVAAETLAADPQGEVIIMPPIRAVYSAVATAAGLFVGRGHDGATGGKMTLAFPVPTDNKRWLKTATARRAMELGINTSPYIEVVMDKGNSHLVQMRDGPVPPMGNDYIPAPMPVRNVLEFEQDMDMLLWESMVESAMPGTVLWVPGASLAAHACVHGIVHGHPVLTRQERPLVGDMLVPTDNVPEVSAASYKVLAATISALLYRHDLGFKGGVPAAIATIQASPLWGEEPHLINLRAWAVLCVARIISAAVLGEMRHWDEHGPGRGEWDRHGGERDRDGNHEGRHIHQKPFPPQFKRLEDKARDQIYGSALKMNPAKLLALVDNCRKSFARDRWHGGFGGSNWSLVAKQCVALWRAILRFRRRPDANTWGDVISKANIAINTSHNNGKVVDKWISCTELDHISVCPTFGLMCTPHAASIALDGFNGARLELFRNWQKLRALRRARRAEKRKQAKVEARALAKVRFPRKPNLKAMLCNAPNCNMCYEQWVMAVTAWRKRVVKLKKAAADKAKGSASIKKPKSFKPLPMDPLDDLGPV